MSTPSSNPGGHCPASAPVKVSRTGNFYLPTGDGSSERTTARRCCTSAAAALAAGCRGEQLSVKVTLINLAGSSGTPSERDQLLLAQVQISLAADPQFQALPKPVLDRAEVNAGQGETEDGYLIPLLPGE